MNQKKYRGIVNDALDSIGEANDLLIEARGDTDLNSNGAEDLRDARFCLGIALKAITRALRMWKSKTGGR